MIFLYPRPIHTPRQTRGNSITFRCENETEIRVISLDRDRRVGGCANEGEPRMKITPVGGYVTYVGDRSLRRTLETGEFRPGWKFPSCQHTHIHAYTDTHTKGKERYLYMDMPLCAEERPSFLGRSGRVSFNDLYIPRGGGRRGGKR